MSTTGIRVLRVCEIVGVVGLILPALLCIWPRLTSLAAAGLALLSIGAIIFHAGQPKKDWDRVMIAIVLLAWAIVVAYGRFVLVPLHCDCNKFGWLVTAFQQFL